MLKFIYRLLTSNYFLLFLFIAFLYKARKWIKKRQKIHKLFKRLGIPYEKPSFFYGSYHKLKGNKKQNEVDTVGQWIKKHGKVFGFFVGSVPYISISDLDMVKQILVKDFANFANRPTLPIKVDPVIHTLVGLRDQRWKDARSLLSPTFSTAKMKLMVNAMNEKVDITMDLIENSVRTKNSVDIYKIFQGLTLDVISECALAMRTNCQKDQEKDEFFTACRDFLKSAVNPAVRLAIYFPPFAKFLAFCSNNLALSGRATMMIKDNLQKVISYRRLRPNERKMDILQLMLDASEDFEDIPEEIYSVTKTSRKQCRNTLSDKEIIANAWVFLLGGFETTAASLTYATYLLSKHPEVQEKLHQELRQNIKTEQKHLNYDDVFNLTYLDQVFSETLRLFPPVVTFLSREAKEDILINDLFIPKGTCVSVPIWQIHHNPEYWPEPNKFDPERFSPTCKLEESRHPMSYIPFGEGPRKCIGMRFAQLEAKLALSRILLTYRLVDSEPDTLTFEIPTVTLTPKAAILTEFVRRT